MLSFCPADAGAQDRVEATALALDVDRLPTELWFPTIERHVLHRSQTPLCVPFLTVFKIKSVNL
jgi:hypothetical protein